MTNKEYIRWLKLLDEELPFDALVDGKDEMDMHEMIWALCEKLEQQPCEDCQRIYKLNPYYDCISRQDAIDKMWEELDEDTAYEVRDILELQPSVMPKQEPCEDCISRAELLKAIDTWDKFGCDADTKLVPYKDHYIPYIHYDDVVKAIKGMPSIQPKTGRWVNGEYCSECGCDVPAYISDWKWQKDMDAKYCPNCGARMESGDKE